MMMVPFTMTMMLQVRCWQECRVVVDSVLCGHVHVKLPCVQVSSRLSLL